LLEYMYWMKKVINILNWNTLKLLIIGILFLIAGYWRLQYFGQTGKDVSAYQKAVEDLLTGVNPYVWTLESFSNPDDPGNHGYAYLPGFMYVLSPLYITSLVTNIPFEVLWKIPVFLGDIGVGILLCLYLYKKNYPALLAGLLLWFFNPYFYIKGSYVYTDPLTIFFMFLSLYYLEKDDVLSGTFYGISIALKTFPYLLFPVMLLNAKNKKNFLIAGLLIGLVVSLPFMTSIETFRTYLEGAVFVHSERFIQGRPFLFYISYFYHIELFQIIPFQVYTLLASFFGWVVALALYLLFKIKDKYILSLVILLNFYLFTPVLNRTYTMWFLPVFILGTYNLFSKTKYKYLYFVALIGYFVFYYWYLIQWKDGFHIWKPL